MAGGFRSPNNSKQETPSATACGGDSSLKREPFPAWGFCLQEICKAPVGRFRKKFLVNCQCLWYSRSTRQIKAERGGLDHPRAPMQERALLHNSFAAPTLIIPESLLLYKCFFARGFVSDKCGVGFTVLRRFCLSRREKPGRERLLSTYLPPPIRSLPRPVPLRRTIFLRGRIL